MLHDSMACRQASLRFLDEVDKVVPTVKEKGSLEAKSLLEGHPATAPLLGLVLRELTMASKTGTVFFLPKILAASLPSAAIRTSTASWPPTT